MLRRVLGCEVECVDPGGGATQVHDLEARFDDGRTAAIEVTSTVDPAHRSLRAQIEKRRWESNALGHVWAVWCRRDFDPGVLRDRFVQPFAVLEEWGVEVFGKGTLPRPVQIDGRWRHVTPWEVNRAEVADGSAFEGLVPLLECLEEIGVTAGVKLGAEVPGRLVIETQLPGGAFGDDSAVSAAIHAVNRPDNLAKLRAADADERHLFFWVHYDAGPAVAALRLRELYPAPPLPPPSLPDGVDVVWIALAMTNPEVPGQLTSLLQRGDASGWVEYEGV